MSAGGIRKNKGDRKKEEAVGWSGRFQTECTGGRSFFAAASENLSAKSLRNKPRKLAVGMHVKNR
jgi:hypothetical protein